MEKHDDPERYLRDGVPFGHIISIDFSNSREQYRSFFVLFHEVYEDSLYGGKYTKGIAFSSCVHVPLIILKIYSIVRPYCSLGVIFEVYSKRSIVARKEIDATSLVADLRINLT